MRVSMLALLALVVATIAVLVPPRVASLEGDVLTMTVWGQPFEDRLFKDVYARGFEQRNPGITVDYQRHSDLEAKYNAWHAKGYGPEVMRLRITTYHQMVARGMLEPLDAYIDDPRSGLSPAELAAFPPQLLDALRVNGKLYALPEDTAQYGLYYNRAIFDEYNRKHPDDRVEYPSAHWTWADLRTAARKLTNRDAASGRAQVAGFDVVIWEWPFMQFFLQAGGELWTEDGLTTTIDSPAAVEALMFLADLVRDGSWKPYFGQMGGLGPNDLFQNGQVAMYLDGSWMIPAFELNAPKLDFAVAPPVHTSRRNMGGSVLWGISSHAPRKDLGWEMLRWLVQEPQAAAYWDKLRVAPPAHLGVIGSHLFRDTAGIPDPSRPGAYLVPPMPESNFGARAQWMVELMTPDPATGKARSYIPASLYQGRLEEEIREMFREFLQQAATADADTARALLARTARNVHAFIDRDRAARNLPPIDRSTR